MKHKLIFICLGLVFLLGLSLLRIPENASAAPLTYSISWSVLGTGGGTMTGSGFELTSTVGQNAISQSADSHFTLSHGFWQSILVRCLQYLPLIIR